MFFLFTLKILNFTLGFGNHKTLIESYFEIKIQLEQNPNYDKVLTTAALTDGNLQETQMLVSL